jgi:hypothetical protein
MAYLTRTDPTRNMNGVSCACRNFKGPSPPPDEAGTSFRLTHRYIRIKAKSGFGSFNLAQTDGTVLALDWVADKTHHILGSAVIVAPGVAVAARHVIDDMRDKGFLGEGGGYLLALGFLKDGGMTVWSANSFGAIGPGDLSILTLVWATDRPATTVALATLAARQPLLGESISLIGFASPEPSFEIDAAIGSFASVGPVTDIYPERRDRNLPTPAAAVWAKSRGGMSGGAAFDAQGRLIGIISKGFNGFNGCEEPTHISLTWPCIFTRIDEVAWPPSLVSGPTSLHSLAEQGLCRIECVEKLHSRFDERGELISLSLDP